MPLYDQLFGDPFGSAPIQSPGQPAPPLPQLSPQDEEGILARLGRGALGGLGYIGGSLDKGFGGRALRGVLGGHPEELLSLIPFSDTLGITNEDNAVSGRQLAGYRPEDDSWGATLGGMGTEMLLDPASYLTFGGKTLLGKTAEKLGALPKAVAPTTTRITNNPFARRFTGQLSTEMRGLSPASDEAAKLAAGIGIPNVAPGPVVPSQMILDDAARELISKRLPGGAFGPVSPASVQSRAEQIAQSMVGPTMAGPVSPRDLAAVSNQPLSALATLSVPFGGELGSIPLGTGKFAQGVADVASNAKDWLTYSRAGRAVTPLFDSRLSEFGAPGSTEAVQRNTRAQADLLAGKTPQILGQHVAERNVVAGAGFDMTDPAQAADLNVRLRQYLEGQQPAVAGVHTPLPSGVEDMAVGQLQELLARHEGAAAVGRTAGRMSDDFTGYFPRGKTRLSDDVFNDPALRQVLAPHNPNDIRRLDPLTEIPLGTAGGINPLLPPEAMPIGGINELFTDPFTKAVPGLPDSIEKRAHYVRRKYLQMSKTDDADFALLTNAVNQGATLPPDAAERLAKYTAKYEQSKQLVGMSSSDIEKAYQGGLAKATSAGQTPIQFARQTRKDMAAGFAPFQNSPLADIQNYRLADEKSNAAARVVMDTLTQNAVAGGGEGMVKVKDALTASGYGNKNARKLLGKNTLNSYIPQDIAADLTRRDTSPFTVPSVLKPVLGLADSATNLNKAFQTKFFPSTIGRNFSGEQYVNILGKAGNPIENTLDAMHVRAGHGLESLADLRNPGVSPFANMTADEALRHYDELAFQHGVQKPFTRAAWDDIIGAPAMDTGAPGTLAPIGERGNIVQAAKDAWANTVTGAQDMRQSLSQPGGFNPLNWEWGGDNALNPIGMAGVGGRTETTNSLGFLGEQAMQAADQVGKHGAFLGFLKQGFDPEVAAQKAIELRMGARKLAPFENEVMRRLVPYYRWSAHNLPQMAESLATEPGGLVGASIRGTNAVRQNEGIMPEWLGEGLAMPVGSRDEQGNQRYLTSLGMPYEDISKIASSGPNAGERVLQKLLANVNPLLKNPIEFATGKQLYSGRDLEDLYSRSGLGPAGEELLGMTPLSRPLNIASTLLDPRKGPLGAATNVLSPGRITDVDMGRAAQIQGRRLLEDELRANPLVREHTDIYVPAEQRARMTPEELQLLSLYRTLLNRARVQGQR